jgi:signal transduction histidine kinase/DNA-binding response OmpR family regulator/ligand-binding sensor domain-containing protein
MRFRQTVVLLVSSLCWCASVVAQGDVFEKITIEQGLSQGMVFDILQTRDGFLWAATKDGLNRYDGYNFKIFSYNPFDPYTLAENTATELFEDSRGLLWIATESKGLDVYDPRRGHFHHFPQLQAVAFAESQDGDLWVVTKAALIRLDIPPTWKDALPEDADLSAFASTQKVRVEDFTDPADRFISLWPKEDGNFVLFSTKKHYEVSSLKNIAWPLATPSFVGDGQGIYQNGGNVWLITPSLHIVYINNGKATQYEPANKVLKGSTTLEKDKQGRFWLSHKGSIWQLEPGKPIDFSKPDWVLDQDVKSLTSDRNGNLWVGTLGYGLRKINPKRRAFHTGVANNSIWRLWQSPQGIYYWRAHTEICTYDPKTGIHDKLAFPTMQTVWKRDMAFEEDGTIWLLDTDKKSLMETLTACDINGNLKQRFTFDINASYYSLFKRTSDGNFWITEAGPSLIYFDTRINEIKRFDFSHLFGEQAAQVQSLAFAQDGNEDFWIGTQQGLVKCGMATGTPQFQLLQTNPNNPQGLNHNAIACVLPDPVKPGEVLWIGTKGGGINCLDIQSGRVRHFTTADGLPDMVVYGILPGNEDLNKERPSLWCSTNRGLAKLAFPKQPQADEKPIITVFSATKGLQGSEFNTQSFFKTTNGELLFGGVNGLNHFFPEEVLPDTTRPPVFIVGILINYEAANLKQRGLKTSLDYLQELQLDYDENNVSFEFAALDFTDPSQNRYRYRLVGVDDDWIETKGTRFAHFAHLPPGRYEFRVQGSNGEGGWQAASNPIVVVIHPPWYRSNLAYVCYALLLAWGAWWAYKFQIRRVKEREQLAFEQRETERVKVLEQLKTNFFSNVTHEFRTPLTLMVEPLRLVLKKSKEPETLENVRLAETNSQKLLSLVNQLLDMSKLESGQMALDLRQGDLGQTVRDVFERFLPLAEKNRVKLTLRSGEDLTIFKKLSNLKYDAGKVELVLNNLISNALKFTPQGEVSINVSKVSSHADVENIKIQVHDSGIGIAPENLPKIFDRFYQVDGSHTRAGEGTGIGLALSKELAELMGGGITAESEVGKGSVFTFWIPVAVGSGWLPADEANSVGLTQTQADAIKPHPPSTVNRPSSTELPLALIIEDNPELRQFIHKSVAGAGWQVIEASDGAEGVQKAIELLPDLIVSDVMMPYKDGFAVVDELKNHELTAHIPIILLTAKAAIDAKLKGLRIGADDYLTKPFNTEELLARMENLVETRRRLRERYGQNTVPPVQVATDEATFLSALDRDFMHRFTLTVERHLSDENISVEDLAQKMFVSRVQLYRKLKALTNQSVTDFVRDYRLDKAKAMLKNREGNVGEVASKVGFGSESYFSRAFKERFGVSPSQVM